MKPMERPRAPGTGNWRDAIKGPFAICAATLLLNGYSPVPILPKTKRPPDEGWNALRVTPLTEEQVRRQAAERPAYGLGVAGEYGGLVPIDIDTDDADIIEAVCSVLPAPLVAKKGRTGYTAFYRAPEGWIASGRKFKPTPTSKPIVEILATGQTVIPPTLHPDTGAPYQWLTPATLLNTPLAMLPRLDADFIERLAEALRPWIQERSAPPPPSEKALASNGSGKKTAIIRPGSAPSDERLRVYALDVLHKRADELAGMPDESGRNNALLAAVSRVGSWVHHGIISESEMRAVFHGAYDKCGAMTAHGLRQFEATTRNGLKLSSGDELRTPESEAVLPPIAIVDVVSLKAEIARNKEGEKVVQLTAVPGVAKPQPELKLVHLADLKLNTAANYLIKGVLPASGLGVVWGPPKNGKSFYVADMALHIALGRTYRDLRVKGGPVVYCILEGADGFSKRMEALKQQLVAEGVDLREIPFYVLSARMELVRDKDALVAAIRAQLGCTPVLVVVDTLNRSFTGSESSDEEMTAYVRAADAITEALTCLTLIVHHCGHDHSRMRGHSSLLGAVDVEISVKREERTGPICARVECMKDGPEGAEFFSDLEEVDVGIDDDGDVITTCLVKAQAKPENFDKKPSKEQTRGKLSDKADIALRALDEAIRAEGQEVPSHHGIPPGVKCVPSGTWRHMARRRGVSDGASESAFRHAFIRLSDSLQKNGYIGALDDWRWIEPNPNDLDFLNRQITILMDEKNKKEG